MSHGPAVYATLIGALMRQRLNRERGSSQHQLLQQQWPDWITSCHQHRSLPPLLLLLLAKAETNCVLPITYAEHNPVEQGLSL